MNGETSGALRLGLQCQALRRFDQAERHFRSAVSEDPRSGAALHCLAAAIHAQDRRDDEALRIIGEALSVEPNDVFHHALRASILNGLERYAEGLASANTARELDPDCEEALIAQAQAFIGQCKWSNAEQAARDALELEPDSANAANLLAVALRMQKKSQEDKEQISGLLERDPENAYTHYNAGWSALHDNNHRKAEEHFREALRLDPEFGPARDGLLTSFRARSPLYRAYLNYCMQMARLNRGARFAVIIGIYLTFRFARTMAGTVSPAFAAGIGVVYFLFVLWSFVADSVGNLILVFDPFAKFALNAREKMDAIVVGGGILVGLPLLLLGIVFNWEATIIFGSCLVAASVPLSLTFKNKSPLGRWVFGTIGVSILAIALVIAGAQLLGYNEFSERALPALGVAATLGFLSTWLSGVRALRS